MRGLLLLVLSFANLNDVWSPDVLPNALLPFTLLREGNVDYDEFVFRPAERDSAALTQKLDSESYFFRACGASTATAAPAVPRSKGGPPAPGPDDHVCSVFPPGMGFLAVPFFLPWIATGANALDLGMLVRVGHLAGAFYEVLATLLLWAVLRRIVDDRAALAIVLLYFLGSSVRTIASQALWQHAGVHLALAAALWLVVRERPLAARQNVIGGLALGLGALVRQTTVFAAAGLAPWREGRTRIAAFLAALAAGLVPLFVFNAFVYGSPLEQGYGAKPFDTNPIEGLAGLLLSPSRGLFVYEPWAMLGLAGLVIARFAKTTRGPLSERISDLVFAWLIALAIYATYAEWWGGRVFGPRFLDDLAPIVVVGLAWGVRGGWFAYGFMRAVFVVSAAWSLLLFNAAALVYDQNTWDLLPVNVNDAPQRLFDWSDPQWLFVLRQLPEGGTRAAAAVALSLLALLFLARVEGLVGSRRP